MVTADDAAVADCLDEMKWVSILLIAVVGDWNTMRNHTFHQMGGQLWTMVT